MQPQIPKLKGCAYDARINILRAYDAILVAAMATVVTSNHGGKILFRLAALAVALAALAALAAAELAVAEELSF